MTIAFQSQFDLGKKGIIPGNANTQDLLGQRGMHLDVDRLTTEPGVIARLSGMETTAVSVIANVEVEPGAIVDWAADAIYGPGKATDGVASGDGAGIVDPFLSESVKIGEVYWLIVKGPALALFTTGTTLIVGDGLQVGAAGRAIKLAAGTKVATVLAPVNTAVVNDTLFRVYADFRF